MDTEEKKTKFAQETKRVISRKCLCSFISKKDNLSLRQPNIKQMAWRLKKMKTKIEDLKYWELSTITSKTPPEIEQTPARRSLRR